jgi:hypothetical protein
MVVVDQEQEGTVRPSNVIPWESIESTLVWELEARDEERAPE